VPLAPALFSLLGAGGQVAELAASYARVLFGGAVVLFFANLATALLRGEGDAKRAMYAMVLGGLLNVGLDPLFIYTFRLGVVGAAWATLASLFCSALLLSSWFFLRRSTYLQLSLGKLRTAYLYAIRLGILIQLGIASFVAAAAPLLSLLFTYAPGSFGLRADLVALLRWMCLFLPTVPLGMLTSAMFNGVKMGGRALLLTFLRTVVLQALGGWALGAALALGERGVWWGIIAANVFMAFVGFTWGTRTVRGLAQKFAPGLSR